MMGDRTLAIVNFLILVFIIYTLVAIIMTPKRTENFSTIYIVNFSGGFSNYPSLLPYNYSYPLLIGVINNEHRMANYSIYISYPEGDNLLLNSSLLEQNSSYEFPFNLTIGWIGRDKASIELFEGDVPKNLSLRIWVNGTPFYVLNKDGYIEIPESYPLYYRLPFKIFLMNEFDENRSFYVDYKYFYSGTDTSSVSPNRILDTTLQPKEIKEISYEILIDKFGRNPIEFDLGSEDYLKTFSFEIEGDTFYVLNESYGLEIPEELPVGTEINIILKLIYIWYTPGYRPLSFILNSSYVPEGLPIENITLLSQERFTLNHGESKEFNFTYEIHEGENIFYHSYIAQNWHDEIILMVNGT